MTKILKNATLVIVGFMLPLAVIEGVLRLFAYDFPLQYQHYLHEDVRVLAQRSKRAKLPHDYIALVGDSYAVGQGDWYFEAIESTPMGIAPFHSADVIHRLMNRDVITFGQPGAASPDGIVYYPIKLYEKIRSRGYDLKPPSRVVVYFYEGNDFRGNVRFLGRYSGHTSADYSEKEISQMLDGILSYGRRVEPGTMRQLSAWIRNLEVMKRLYVARMVGVLAKEVLMRDDGAQQTSERISVTVNHKVINVHEGPPMTMTDHIREKSLLVFKQSLRHLMKYFSDARFLVVYIPSPLTSYQIADETVTLPIPTGGGRQFNAEDVYAVSDGLCRLIADVAMLWGADFLDVRPYIRQRAADEFLHGPRDLGHFNRAGYEVLGQSVADWLTSRTKSSTCATPQAASSG